METLEIKYHNWCFMTFCTWLSLEASCCAESESPRIPVYRIIIEKSGCNAGMSCKCTGAVIKPGWHSAKTLMRRQQRLILVTARSRRQFCAPHMRQKCTDYSQTCSRPRARKESGWRETRICSNWDTPLLAGRHTLALGMCCELLNLLKPLC